MQLHISPSLRHVTVLPGKGVREFIKVKVGSRRLSYRMVFYSLLFLTFVLRFIFVLTAVNTIDGQTKCSTLDEATAQKRNGYSLKANIAAEYKNDDARTQNNFSWFGPIVSTAYILVLIPMWYRESLPFNKNNSKLDYDLKQPLIPQIPGCLGKKLGPRILGQRLESQIPEVIYQVLEEPPSLNEIKGEVEIPQSLEEFVAEIKKEGVSDAKTFAVKLKAMVTLLEERTRRAKIQEYLYRHVASSSIPKQLHCLALRLANEHAMNANARLQLPSPELVPALVDNSFFHFVLASDNILAASVVANSLVHNSLYPEKVVLHIITDRKTYSPMQAWFSLHPLTPAIIEVKGLHHFDWLTKGKVPVLEAMEKDQRVRSQFRGGSSAIVANNTEKPYVIASKLQALSPKYNSLMNHIRIYLPELFPSLNKVVFLDDDVVVQTDLSALWDIDMNGKVNGAVETCRGGDKFVMSKRLKSYLNFSHPLISQNFDPNECAWAYGMNIFDLEAWRKTDISKTYDYWLKQNLKSDLSLWQLGTLPPGLIAFHGHVKIIDPFWHMLGLGYQENTSIADAKSAGVIHFNGRAKPWLDIAFPQLQKLWTKYVNPSDKFIKGCHIRT